jgi:hypothetical protein
MHFSCQFMHKRLKRLQGIINGGWDPGGGPKKDSASWDTASGYGQSIKQNCFLILHSKYHLHPLSLKPLRLPWKGIKNCLDQKSKYFANFSSKFWIINDKIHMQDQFISSCGKWKTSWWKVKTCVCIMMRKLSLDKQWES